MAVIGEDAARYFDEVSLSEHVVSAAHFVLKQQDAIAWYDVEGDGGRNSVFICDREFPNNDCDLCVTAPLAIPVKERRTVERVELEGDSKQAAQVFRGLQAPQTARETLIQAWIRIKCTREDIGLGSRTSNQTCLIL